MTAPARYTAESTIRKSTLSQQVMMEQLMSIARTSALEEMASGIAHELNQPLGAITMFSQAAERMLDRSEPMASEALEVMRLISKEALSAGEGIRSMRRLFNRDNIPKAPASMGDVVRELSPILEGLALRSGGSLTIEVDKDLSLVNIHRLRIQHVLFTLVQNAFEAGDAPFRDQPALPTAVQVQVWGDRYSVEVSVTDNGGGIRSEHRDQIFRPFFTTKPAGTGLGLASTRAIVEAHEGTIGFRNLERHGTQFWFRVPVIDQ